MKCDVRDPRHHLPTYHSVHFGLKETLQLRERDAAALSVADFRRAAGALVLVAY